MNSFKATKFTALFIGGIVLGGASITSAIALFICVIVLVAFL